ncbi:ATP-grasp domain-containing protein [Oceanobacillus sp. 1P07AA]|uniref:ATP-grasp domain-containing protein n=1 Tax=Oceanobacillus sp. 1P07AA TaxID=3132293 RepID=UPI0039A5D18D
MTVGWLIYSEGDAIKNASYIEWFQLEATKQGLSLQLIIREQLTVGINTNQPILCYDNKQITIPDFAIVRYMDPLLSKHLEGIGISVFNSSTISQIFNHKGYTHNAIIQTGVSMPDTYYYSNGLLPHNPPLGFPFIGKIANGKGGKQVSLIHNMNEWDTYRLNCHSDIILQSTEDIQFGKDIRVFVIGKQIIGAVLRESKTDFRANYTLGGTASLYNLTSHQRSLVQKIIDEFHFDMVGIDFLLSTEGELRFNEIEDVVGSRTWSKVSNINLLELYIKHIKSSI